MKTELSRLLARERFPHALLIEASTEEAAAEFARQVALAVLCRAPEGERPCGQCAPCKKIAAGSHPDFLSYEGEGKSRAISVDRVRAVRAAAYVLPNESERKILLLRGADAMLPPAQNALLKILEEPPDSAVFILTATNRWSLLETVRSRVQIVTTQSEPESGAHPPCHDDVLRLLGHITRGEEANALALLAGHEKDRAEFLGLLDGLRGHLLNIMPESGAGKADKLWAYVQAIDETKRAAQSNVGTALLGCALCAALFDTNPH